MQVITEKQLEHFQQHLLAQEHSAATVEKYLRDVRAFVVWLRGAPLSKNAVSKWKEHLLAARNSPATVNAKLAALGAFLTCQGWDCCRVKPLKLQRRLFCDTSRELGREAYVRLLETAHALGKTRLSLLMETICSTGIRVSELQYITLEAAQQGRAEISLKGKIRTILIPGKLCRKLQKYARKEKITSGEVFLTRTGKRLSRKQIWAEMKALCDRAGVARSKVYPHNLRHLFARCFYKACRDISKLADVLGHSSIETTRIYLICSSAEHAQTLERLHLIL